MYPGRIYATNYYYADLLDISLRQVYLTGITEYHLGESEEECYYDSAEEDYTV